MWLSWDFAETLRVLEDYSRWTSNVAPWASRPAAASGNGIPPGRSCWTGMGATRI